LVHCIGVGGKMHIQCGIVHRGKMPTPLGILTHMRGKMPMFSLIILFTNTKKMYRCFTHNNSVIATRFLTTISL